MQVIPRECAFQRYPSVVSRGIGRPLQYQAAIAERLLATDKTRDDFTTLPQLIHGVCYSVPVARLARWDLSAAGSAYGGPVVS